MNSPASFYGECPPPHPLRSAEEMAMKLTILILIASLMLVNQVLALDAVVTEMEGTKRTYVFHIDLSKHTIGATTNTPGKTIPPIQHYVTKNDRHFWAEGNRFGKADDILTQIHTEDADLLLVRREHNSFWTPLRFLFAISGHPIQVSSIWLVVIRDKKEVWSAKLVSRDSIYRWQASIHE